MSLIKHVNVGGKTIQFEFNKFAKQANGAVMVSSGETQVLVTVCANLGQSTEGQDFFPLSVDYIEKFYAAGRIPGGFIKRETKPSERETLTARVIDRPLRPCFPKEFMCETHIVATVLSIDFENHPAPLALMGASTALMISDIPFNGPVCAIRLGMSSDGKFILDPSELEDSDLDLNMAANPTAVLMVEAGSNFLSEEKMLDAISYAHELMRPVFDMQLEVQREIGKQKVALSSTAEDLEIFEQIKSSAKGRLLECYSVQGKQARNDAIHQLEQNLQKDFNPESDPLKCKKIASAFEKLSYHTMRDMILYERRRIDQRSYTQIRPISCETGLLKRCHGSSLFTRGETQSLSAVTLGSGDDEQKLDTVLTPGISKRFMLHYNFPPFSVGEARNLRAPGRREIGHGNLAERALSRVLPKSEKFNYTIRLVSEILESNGSSSMATVCAGTLAMLNAGIPLLDPVAGIAMGLIKQGNDYAILSDILGDEDHLGDMDFKVAGSKNGITALQMDIKIGGIDRSILAAALDQAKAGRLEILEKMKESINKPVELSEHAPRIFQIKIKPDKVRDVIGPGGKVIKSIVADFGVKIDVSDDGIVCIVAPSASKAEAAKKFIRNLTSDPNIGAICLGKVTRVMDFGAFVEIKPGLEGLLHISQLDNHRVENVTDVIREGDDILVKIIDVDRQGKVKLSRKEALGKKPTM
ncbi:MAG: polyribonucleotide nucleotidyltransferase [Oligoflexales bacterium]|nr:polyribonucleotide nucleotidyltransferase [Oligoflexales bacterium]